MNALDRQHAHDLLDRLDGVQLEAVTHLMEVMADPVARAIARAPVDDEPLTAEEERALDEARGWIEHNRGIPHEQVLAKLGITRQEIDGFREPA